ncbi:MAG: hypothetical protein A2W31_05760 [Planctomycetes bacterium RBG_16_64_10]|nr:MAG: hypothetical protein A2W31_05760 [Planctomycetes bacterium RBG_16_64_10]
MKTIMATNANALKQPVWIALVAAAALASTTARAADHHWNLVLCCAADNDLYQVLTAGGNNVPRYDSANAALEAAATGAGVLILADGYPDQPTAIDPTMFDLAKQQGLRLYVEYPASVPGIEIGAPRSTRVERAVITSDFFGRELAPLRIVAINGLHLVPAAFAKSHIVAARVAGFDTAVFGLPERTDPVLFEHPSGQVLIATTKLSHFVTGRYAPQDAWKGIWRAVLAWLGRDARLPELTWEPIVRPTYGRDDPLPEDVERQALRRGVAWFRNSKLLLHPSRMDQVDQAAKAGGLVPTPPADAPTGDGTLGILEAPLSIIGSDGSQLQSVARRGDCTGESAMALAFGGQVFGDAELSRTASNLLDFWYFTSDACQKERADPNHGAYGLIAWGVSASPWYVANYGDDNARLLMGSWATAALLGEDRWDELMMRCLLANLRTTGQLGFRGGRIDVPDLGTQGWQPFFRRQIVNPWPHYEAYLWACYLWAYRQTGCELFCQRAKTALRITMEQYTDGWYWTNGLAQEKARILLPLAWLVRVEDTAEHRAWLRRAFTGLAALQQPCGAIQEELGRPGRGSYAPPTSNDAYGGDEASLIQQNGDPVCDLLYTTNFALLGLHEAAAATGDLDMIEAENRLAKFLCRIQVDSRRQPALDGGWFRAFDFKRWEHWGSNADAGWGAWAIESGWTQGWITSVLALRQLRTSLWDLTKNSQIHRHFAQYQRQMLPAEVISQQTPRRQ